MAQLPLIQTNTPQLMDVETKWKSALDPVLANLLVQGLLLPNIAIINGTNVINHKLGRMMQGWIVVDVTAGAAIYRTAPLNALTLTLSSGAPGILSLWVF